MHRHTPSDGEISDTRGSIALVGHPNVGKSVIFQCLTGHYVTVSNYPGTTVEVSRGNAQDIPKTMVIDTPGMIAFPPQSEDEYVTERVLLHEKLRAIVQVGDAKNLQRTLLLTLQLAEMGVPFVLDLNMMDEANARGVSIDHGLLAKHLDVSVVPTIAVRKEGIEALTTAIETALPPRFRLGYPKAIEAEVKEITPHLPAAPIAQRALALMWLSGDTLAQDWIQERVGEERFQSLIQSRQRLETLLRQQPSDVIRQTRLDYIDHISPQVLSDRGKMRTGFAEKLGQICTHPVWGLGIVAIVLYGMYWFVGVFGAGTLVNLIEGKLFGELINPWIIDAINRLIPVPLIADFLVGEYGLWTLGITYAFALILPIVSTFFLAFGVLEDSGYLPRLTVLSNRLFRIMGLNGKAVLPMVLGLGCVTMATLTTRIMSNKRDRLLVILLLALAIPCSAQLGVVMGLLAGVSFTAAMIWCAIVLGVLLFVGWLAARLIPGERSPLMIELPPLRWPVLRNVVIKTLARLEWYLKEVVALFLIGAAIMFGLEKTGILDWMIRSAEPLVTGWLGLPASASAAFLQGFVRRDFGATGLFVMEAQGMLNPVQVVVSMVTVTLFVPCIASVFMIAKERGWRTSLAIIAVIMPMAFLIGGLLYRVLMLIGWGT
ncbi:MAG: ferrous iron transport protein B [Anaerolineales bacterium]|jgi:ferrous iron transport protein B